HYIMSFGKIGYNNLQALFAMALALWASCWAIRSRRPIALVSAGMATAFCCYVYPAATYVIPLAVLVLLIYDPPVSKASIARLGIVLATMSLFIAPLLLQFQYWATKIAGTYLNPARVEQGQ